MYVVTEGRRDKYKSNAGQMSGYNSINTSAYKKRT